MRNKDKIGYLRQPNNKAHQIVIHVCKEKNFELDYLAVADADSLEILTAYQHGRSLVALTAATYDEVRLIDNMLLNQD